MQGIARMRRETGKQRTRLMSQLSVGGYDLCLGNWLWVSLSRWPFRRCGPHKGGLHPLPQRPGALQVGGRAAQQRERRQGAQEQERPQDVRSLLRAVWSVQAGPPTYSAGCGAGKLRWRRATIPRCLPSSNRLLCRKTTWQSWRWRSPFAPVAGSAQAACRCTSPPYLATMAKRSLPTSVLAQRNRYSVFAASQPACVCQIWRTKAKMLYAMKRMREAHECCKQGFELLPGDHELEDLLWDIGERM